MLTASDRDLQPSRDSSSGSCCWSWCGGLGQPVAEPGGPQRERHGARRGGGAQPFRCVAGHSRVVTHRRDDGRLQRRRALAPTARGSLSVGRTPAASGRRSRPNPRSWDTTGLPSNSTKSWHCFLAKASGHWLDRIRTWGIGDVAAAVYLYAPTRCPGSAQVIEPLARREAERVPDQVQQPCKRVSGDSGCSCHPVHHPRIVRLRLQHPDLLRHTTRRPGVASPLHPLTHSGSWYRWGTVRVQDLRLQICEAPSPSSRGTPVPLPQPHLSVRGR